MSRNTPKVSVPLVHEAGILGSTVEACRSAARRVQDRTRADGIQPYRAAELARVAALLDVAGDAIFAALSAANVYGECTEASAAIARLLNQARPDYATAEAIAAMTDSQPAADQPAEAHS